MSGRFSRWNGAGMICLALLACGATPARADSSDPPARAARLSDLDGAVSLQPAGVQDWTDATLNRPLTTGDRLWADQQARAEVDFGDAAVRLGSSTGFSFLNLDDSTAQMQVTGGTVLVHVRAVQPGQIYEVDTPNLALSLQDPGDYRIDVAESGDATVVRVGEGAALAAGGGQTVSISAQQEVRFTGTNTLTYAMETPAPQDELDSWSAAREQQVEDSASSDYVATNVPGTQDLDNSGTWQDTPDYGYVWTPTTVIVGWTPYRYGHWVWIGPWGWTWIDDARWGYVPFHYGRWVQWNDAWCWVPGPRGLRPVYAPALVAWVGAPGGGAPPGAFDGTVGWFPLAPREVYVPAYAVSNAYVRSVNVTNTTIVNTTNITSIYRNNIPPAHYANNRAAAVTSVPQAVFTSGQRVAGSAMHLTPTVLSGALVSSTAPTIVPVRQSVLGVSDARRIPRPPAVLQHRTVVAHAVPPRAPVSFDSLQAAMQGNGGRPLTRAEMMQLQPGTPAVAVRVLAITGPVVAATALAGHAASAAPAAPAPSLAERERILQSSTRLPPSPHAPGSVAPTVRVNPYIPTPPEPEAVPAWHADRPPTALQNLPSSQQRAFSADDPTHAYGRPATLPVYHPPVTVDDGQPARSAHTNQPAWHAPAAPPQPPREQPGKSSRDSAPHADRDSRERITR
jgi:hypothetical protein